MSLVLYICAISVWFLLLYPYPTTVFLAACLSCALYPLFLRIQAYLPGWRGIMTYLFLICGMLILPISILVLLVVPQATAGYHMLQKLRESNFQIPQAWLEQWEAIKVKLSVIPGLEGMIDDFVNNIDSLLGKSVSTVVSGGVGFVGGTLTAVWLIFLFFTLSILCTLYAKRLYHLCISVTKMPSVMLDRFIVAIRGALRGVLMGVVLVALAQGILCGIGFAVAGINQPAFWGMLATLVAPIPIVGTALVWLPLAIMLWFTGEMWSAIGLSIWGMVAVAGVDNLLRPLFLQQGINAPIFVLVLAILCGMASFGAVGLIAGPVLVAFGIQALHEADLLHNTHTDV